MGDRSEPNTNRVRDAYGSRLSDLFAAGEVMQTLMAQPGWAILVELVEAEVHDLDRKLDGRPLDNIQAYAFDHGRRGGLLAFTEHARAVVSYALAKEREQRLKYEGASEHALNGA